MSFAQGFAFFVSVATKIKSRFKIEKYINPAGSEAFRVSGYKSTGKRVRKNFQSQGDAIEFQNSLELEAANSKTSVNLRRTVLSDSQLGDAEVALRALLSSEFGPRTLSAAVQELLSAKDRIARLNVGWHNALKFLEENYKEGIRNISVMAAATEYLKSCQNKASATIAYYKRCCKKLVEYDPNRMVNSFSKQDILNILGDFQHVGNKRAYKRGFSAFFGWAQNQNYCSENPCASIVLRSSNSTAVRILSLKEVKSLLNVSRQMFNGEMVASIAILLFAGLRPSELYALKVSDLDLKDKFIVVAGGKMRSKGRRRTPISANLHKWLQKYPFNGIPQGWDYRRNRIFSLAEIENPVPDVLRHTSISYQCQRDSDVGKVAMDNGTSSEMIHRHYRDLVSTKDCKAFWALDPSMAISKKKVVAASATVKKVRWPSDKTLKKLVADSSYSAVGRELGVSDVAVRKRCQKRGILIS